MRIGSELQERSGGQSSHVQVTQHTADRKGRKAFLTNDEAFSGYIGLRICGLLAVLASRIVRCHAPTHVTRSKKTRREEKVVLPARLGDEMDRKRGGDPAVILCCQAEICRNLMESLVKNREGTMQLAGKRTSLRCHCSRRGRRPH